MHKLLYMYDYRIRNSTPKLKAKTICESECLNVAECTSHANKILFKTRSNSVVSATSKNKQHLMLHTESDMYLVVYVFKRNDFPYENRF